MLGERLRGVVDEGIQAARQPGGLSAELGQRGFIPEEKDRAVVLLKSTLKARGLEGDVVLFCRSNGAGDPVGVPVRNENGYNYSIGLYTGSSQDVPRVKEAMDVYYGLMYNRRWNPPWEDGLEVATEENLGAWEKEGLFWKTAPGDSLPAASQLYTNQEKLELARRANREFIQQQYLPGVMRALGMLGMCGRSVSDLSFAPGENGFEKVLVRAGGDCDTRANFVNVMLGRIIDTSHKTEQKAWVMDRDHWRCIFPGTQSQLQYTSEEYLFWEEVAWYFRHEPNVRQSYMQDYAKRRATHGFYSLDIPACGEFVRGSYPVIAPNMKRLRQDWAGSEYHHIFPRGMAAMAVLTLMLQGKRMDKQVQKMDPREVMLILRGTNISELLSGTHFHLFKNEGVVLRQLAANAGFIEKTINSPWNTATVCHNCHNLLHPEHDYLQELSALVQRAETGELHLNLNDDSFSTQSGELTEAILSHELEPLYHQNEWEMFEDLYIVRRLVSGSGRPHWRVGLMDKMLDVARRATDDRGGDRNFPYVKKDLSKSKRFLAWVRSTYPAHTI